MGPLNENDVVLKSNSVNMCNCMVSMTTHYAILKNGSVSTKDFIFQQQLILNLVSNESLDIVILFNGVIGKFSNFHIHDF